MIANALAARNRSGGVVVPPTLPISVGLDGFTVKYSITGVAQWAATIRGDGSDVGNAVATDSTGVYVTGNYTSTSAVNLGSGVILPVSSGSTDTFIIKYNRSGVAQWAATVPATSSDTGNGIATDSTGVYVIGTYSSTSVVTLNNGKTLPASLDSDAFIVKYDTSGQAQWVATVGSGGIFDGGRGIATDSTGVYVTGNYTSASVVTLNNGKTLPASVDQDAFIVKYDTSGQAQWTATVPGTGSEIGYGIATDSTGVYVTGRYSSTSVVTLNNGKTLPISVLLDAFIVKYDTSGQAQWTATVPGTGNDQGFGIATDSTGVYVTGTYSSTSVVTLNNGKTLPATVLFDAFIVKYDTSGQAQWVATVGSNGNDGGYGIATDSTGVYVTGQYSSSSPVTLNNGKTLPISVGLDAFIVKYDTSGQAQWTATVPGTGSDIGYGIATDSTGVYVTGQYTSTTIVTL